MNADLVFDVGNDDNKSSNFNADIKILYIRRVAETKVNKVTK